MNNFPKISVGMLAGLLAAMVLAAVAALAVGLRMTVIAQRQSQQLAGEVKADIRDLLGTLDPDGSMRARAEEFKAQARDDQRLQLETVCVISDQNLTAIAQFSPTEGALAVITKGKSVAIYRTDGTRLRELTWPDTHVTALAYAPDGRRLLLGTNTGKLWLWDVTANAPQEIPSPLAGAVGRVVWLANPERIVVTGNLMGQPSGTRAQPGFVLQLPVGKVLAKFEGNFFRDDFQTLAASPDGRFIGLLEVPGQARAAFLLNAESGQIDAKLHDDEYSSGPLSIGIAPDNNTVAVGYAPYNLSLWDSAHQKELRLIEAHKNWVVSLAFSPDSARLISGAGDSTARIWNVATGKEIGRIRFAGSSNYIDSVGFSADGKLVFAAGSDDRIVVAKAPPAAPTLP